MISLEWTPRLWASIRTPTGSSSSRILGSAFHGFFWQARPACSACLGRKLAAERFRPLLSGQPCSSASPFLSLFNSYGLLCPSISGKASDGLVKHGPWATLPAPSQRGTGRTCGFLHNQCCVAALPLSLVRNGRRRVFSFPRRSGFETVAHSSQHSRQAQEMARRSSTRNKVALSQPKSESQGSSDEQGDDEGPDLKDSKHCLSAQVQVQVQPNDVDISEQIQLKTRLTACQKAGNLTGLTVAELKGILRMWNRPTARKKQELLQELKTILADSKSSLPATHSGDVGEADQESLRKNTAEVDNEAPLMADSRKRGRAHTKKTGVQEETVATITTVGEEPRTTVKVYRSKKGKATKTDVVLDAVGGNVEVAVTETVRVKEVWATFNHKKPKPEWYAYDPRTMRPPFPPDRGHFHKLISWNVNGIRALLKGKDPKTHDAAIFKDLAEREDFDVLCLQETKLQEKDVEKVKDCLLPDYQGSYWSCSTAKLGYSGTAIISRAEPLSVTYGLGITDHDKEGRVITAEYESFFLVTSYVPNSGDGLKRLDYRITDWDPALSNHVKKLEEKKPVILTGDLNCSHQEMDIADPNGNRRSAGFTNEERASFEESYLKKGMVDTFRRQHPNAVGYTYWGYRTGARARNHGWRLDYFLASEALTDRLHDSFSLPHIQGSDHCPIGLIITR